MPQIEIIPPGEPIHLSPASSVFAHGFGIFETMRIRNGRLEFWEAHWKRLSTSARTLGMACPEDSESVLAAVLELAKALAENAVVKLSLIPDGASTKLLVYSRPRHSLPDEIGLLMETAGPINERSPLAGHKTHNYLENMMVLRAAHAAGCYDGLRLNLRGQLAEGAISNLFFRRQSTWYTPALETGILPGILREAAIHVLDVVEGCYEKEALLSADAVFLTNSLVGFLPVNWLLDGAEKITLSSGQQPCCSLACSLIEERTAECSIQVS